jgi:hypothetical protein
MAVGGLTSIKKGKSMKIYFLALVGLLACGVVAAGDISPVVGHYRYQDYAATLADGRVIKLQDMGATDAFLDISEAEAGWVSDATQGRVGPAEGRHMDVPAG